MSTTPPVNVPNVPGVPPVNFAPGFVTPQKAFADGVTFPGPLTWGIYKNGSPIITADSVVTHEFKKEFAISDYPIEGGQFQSFDKVFIPYDARFRFVSAGSQNNRTALLASIEAVIGDLNLYDVVTPEFTYPNVNLVHYNYQRTATRGLGALVVDVWALQVQPAQGQSLSNTQQPDGTDQTNGGQVQSNAPGMMASAAATAQIAVPINAQGFGVGPV